MRIAPKIGVVRRNPHGPDVAAPDSMLGVNPPKKGYPALYGTREAAEVLGVARPNLKDVAGIADCVYPGGRVEATPLFLADAIHKLAQERKSRPQYQAAQLAKRERPDKT